MDRGYGASQEKLCQTHEEGRMIIRIANLTLFCTVTMYYLDPFLGALVWLGIVSVEKATAAVFAW